MTTKSSHSIEEEVARTATFQKLGKISSISIWTGSTFESIRRISSPRAKGATAEKIVSEIMLSRGYSVGRPTNSDFDRFIGGHKTEIKMSTTWDNKLDAFTWQQIREGQDYERIIFMGVNPDSIRLYWATKKDIQQHIFGKDEFRQHAGKDGGLDVYWIQRKASLPWFRLINTF